MQRAKHHAKKIGQPYATSILLRNSALEYPQDSNKEKCVTGVLVGGIDTSLSPINLTYQPNCGDRKQDNFCRTT